MKHTEQIIVIKLKFYLFSIDIAMNAYIIAAGNGNRLSDAGLNTKKPLIRIGGMPMIERLIEILSRNGFDKFRVMLNEDSTDVATLLLSLKINRKLDIDFVVKSTPSSMHSFYELSRAFRLEPFYMFTVDTIFDESEFRLFTHFCSTQTHFDSVMAVTRHIDDEKPLYVRYSGDSILEFRNDAASDMITSGFYYFAHDQTDRLRPLIESGKERLRLFLADYALSGAKVGLFTFSKTIDLDRIEDIALAEAFVARCEEN